jgi:hypothetical protein
MNAQSPYIELSVLLTLRAKADMNMFDRYGVVRDKYDPDILRMNADFLKGTIRRIGCWPDAPKVGDEASHGAWRIAYHADHDPAFQQQCLALMRACPSMESVSSRDIAYLHDRVCVNLGRPQLYGTQIEYMNCRYVPKGSVFDLKGLDERRSHMKLCSFIGHLKRVNEGKYPLTEEL